MFLLDSHALLWSLYAPPELSLAARKKIEDEANPIFFSAASVWEIAIKTAKGRLETEDRFVAAISEMGFVEVPVRAVHAWEVQRLPAIHGDPFDRILVAQARVERLTLITRDRFLADYGIQTLTA